MFVLGLTGPTGSGKSLVAGMLEKRGFAVLAADRAARAVMEPGGRCLQALAAAFGNEILLPDGSLDRKRLAALVFREKSALETLNTITHPPILRLLGEEMERLRGQGTAYAVLDAPALFESGAHRMCGRVLAVTAPSGIRLERIMERDRLPREAARARMEAQPPAGFYTAKADYVIENVGPASRVEAEIQALCREIVGLEGRKN